MENVMDRWQAKLERTRAAFSWYDRLLPQGFALDVREAASRLPLMDADVLDRHYYAAPVEGACAVYRTSGTSSGVRKSIAYSERDEELYVKAKTRLFAELTKGAGIRRALADMGTGHAASTALDVFRGLGFEGDAIAFDEPIERHAAKLADFRPELLYTMPSILERIAGAAADPAACGIRRIILVGEIAPPEWRRRMARRFGIGEEDVVDTYGSIEIGTIAYFSHRHGVYLFAEGIEAEGIRAEELDEGIGPLAENESILVLTSFIRDLFPALRFVTYDVVRDLKSEWIDGRKVQTFGGIVKRVGRELKHGEKISLYDIEEVVYRYLSRAEVRVAVERNALRVRIASPELTPELLTLLRAAIEEKVPEIGSMIAGGILGSIEVTAAGPREESGGARPVKGKKLYYGDSKAKDGSGHGG